MILSKQLLIKSAATALTIMSLSISGFAQAEKVKAGFIYVGPVGDFGWSYEHDKGRLAVEEALGDSFKSN